MAARLTKGKKNEGASKKTATIIISKGKNGGQKMFI